MLVGSRHRLHTGIPQHYFTNPLLQEAVSILPPHYNFQVQKTLHRIDAMTKELNVSHLNVSLQFPEGLMMFACLISDILTEFSGAHVFVMGDVTYGACCVDDIASHAMECQLLIHYGHSCLVPITQTHDRVLYVFVEIMLDTDHLCRTVRANYPIHSHLTLMGTIQFVTALYQIKEKLGGEYELSIPQNKPRSGGEVLGCTAPVLSKGERVLFVCDGRFHMEAAMIANPSCVFHQYDPYAKTITEERQYRLYKGTVVAILRYALTKMLGERQREMKRVGERVCIVFGALGRQGNVGILSRLVQKIQNHFQYMVLIASEINVQLLTSIDVDFFVQIACPRLSIDWGGAAPKPLLTTFEIYAVMDKLDITEGYRMDYYSHEGGPWSNYYGKTGVNKKKAVVRLEYERKGEEVVRNEVRKL